MEDLLDDILRELKKISDKLDTLDETMSTLANDSYSFMIYNETTDVTKLLKSISKDIKDLI